jgi:dTDP-4-amino-4,6-dideoxygalactose transaminase
LHLYTLLIDETRSPVTRDQFIMALHKRKIGTGVHYRSIPVHPVYQHRFGWKPEDYPVANAIGMATVSLPISARLDDQDVADVIAATKEVLSGGN